MKIREIDIDTLEIHELANLTPLMSDEQYEALKHSIELNGQQVPIVTYRGKVIDGRHRIKALKELGKKTVKAIAEDSTLTIDDIRDKIMNVYENRRHQSVTQKAIMAYRYYTTKKKFGEKISQGEAAALIGTTRLQLSRAQKLHSLAGDTIINILFNGGKIDIGTKIKPYNTDNLLSLINYFKNRIDEIIEKTDNNNANIEDLTDDEKDYINNKFEEIKAEANNITMKKLEDMLYKFSFS
jgi:hypothetical protein